MYAKFGVLSTIDFKEVKVSILKNQNFHLYFLEFMFLKFLANGTQKYDI